MKPRETGDMGEELAVRYLTSQGHTIVARNYVIRGGEVDIISRDGADLVFCEVKTRGARSMGLPSEAVTPEKQRRICRTALSYVHKNDLYELPVRFDIIEIYTDTKTVRHIKNAFEYLE